MQDSDTEVDDPPLKGLIVVELSQFLAGPYAALRMQDLGARVIKVEHPVRGDLSRTMYVTDTQIDGDSTIFHAINRSKESIALDLKLPSDLAALGKLLKHADIVIENFRPGVTARLGLDYESVRRINPRIVYGSVTGYGTSGPWVGRPGQDLLAQARSGVMWLNGDRDQGPVPFGLAIADMLAGSAVAHGVLAALVRRERSGRGGLVETSLLEVLIDFQFEVLTTYLNDGRRLPTRAKFRSAHAYLSAPYGVYQTQDGFIAVAMTPLPKLMEVLGMGSLAPYVHDHRTWFSDRDEIKQLIAGHLATDKTEKWLSLLEPADIWCAAVLDWPELLESDGFAPLQMLQTLERAAGIPIMTTRAPLRIDGSRPRGRQAAPTLGQHSEQIRAEFDL